MQNRKNVGPVPIYCAAACLELCSPDPNYDLWVFELKGKLSRKLALCLHLGYGVLFGMFTRRLVFTGSSDKTVLRLIIRMALTIRNCINLYHCKLIGRLFVVIVIRLSVTDVLWLNGARLLLVTNRKWHTLFQMT